MEECEELARGQGGNHWALAASFAQVMLPKIFRLDDPVLDVQLPPETRLALERTLQALSNPDHLYGRRFARVDVSVLASGECE